MFRFFKKSNKKQVVNTLDVPKQKVFTTDILNELDQKVIFRYPSECGKFNYTCYRIGNNVAINKAGATFGNSGSHGIYSYCISSDLFTLTAYKYMDDLVMEILRGY